MSWLCLMVLSHYAHPQISVRRSTATHFIAQSRCAKLVTSHIFVQEA